MDDDPDLWEHPGNTTNPDVFERRLAAQLARGASSSAKRQQRQLGRRTAELAPSVHGWVPAEKTQQQAVPGNLDGVWSTRPDTGQPVFIPARPKQRAWPGPYSHL